MCVYFGDQTPLAFVEEPEEGEEEKEEDFIEINSRDFMAALQRLLAVKFDKFQGALDALPQNTNCSPFLRDFTLVKLIDPEQFAEPADGVISPAIIRSLC